MNTSQKSHGRRGLAPLELVLALPILLFVMALIVCYGTISAWKVREHSVARLAAWETRWRSSTENIRRSVAQSWSNSTIPASPLRNKSPPFPDIRVRPSFLTWRRWQRTYSTIVRQLPIRCGKERRMRHVKLIASVLAAMSLSFVLADTTSSAAESAASRDKKEGRLMESTTTMPELTREYLLANGFKPLAASPDSFIAEKVRLGDVASILGFKITSLRPTVSQPDHSDVRTGSVQSRRFVVRSEVRDTQGKIVRGSLNEANSLCTVTISLKKVATAKPPLPTDSSPGVRVKSVTVPKRRTEPLQIVFELSADGKSPLAVTEAQVSVRSVRWRNVCLRVATLQRTRRTFFECSQGSHRPSASP